MFRTANKTTPRRRGESLAGTPPRGALLVVVAGTLLVVILLSSTLVRALLIDRRASRAAERRLQAVWIAESAVERARYKLRTSDGYAGETWQLAVNELDGQHSGIAIIDVEPAVDASSWRIRVMARYPQAASERTTVSRELTMRHPPGAAAPEQPTAYTLARRASTPHLPSPDDRPRTARSDLKTKAAARGESNNNARRGDRL